MAVPGTIKPSEREKSRLEGPSDRPVIEGDSARIAGDGTFSPSTLLKC